MALGAFVAGRYSATLNAVAIGMSKQGFELEFQFKHEVIEESDLYGLTILDLIVRGANTYVSAMLKEWNAGSKAILWSLGGSVLGKIFSTAVPCGSLASALASPLVFTSTANTPAAASPATLTASLAYPADNFNPKTLFDSRLRELPVRMIALPSVSGSDLVGFSTT